LPRAHRRVKFALKRAKRRAGRRDTDASSGVRALEVDVGGVLLAQRIDLRLPARLGRLDRRLLAPALDPDRRLALRVAAVALGGDGCLLRRRALRRLLGDGLAARPRGSRAG
jgi:hypothetical protein